MVEEDQVSFNRRCDAGNFFHFAGADQGGWIEFGAALDEFCGHFAACAQDQLAKFG